MSFTVGELKAALEGYPDEMNLILSPDDEGNALHQVQGIGERYIETLRHHYVDAVSEEYVDETDTLVLEIW